MRIWVPRCVKCGSCRWWIGICVPARSLRRVSTAGVKVKHAAPRSPPCALPKITEPCPRAHKAPESRVWSGYNDFCKRVGCRSCATSTSLFAGCHSNSLFCFSFFFLLFEKWPSQKCHDESLCRSEIRHNNVSSTGNWCFLPGVEILETTNCMSGWRGGWVQDSTDTCLVSECCRN